MFRTKLEQAANFFKGKKRAEETKKYDSRDGEYTYTYGSSEDGSKKKEKPRDEEFQCSRTAYSEHESLMNDRETTNSCGLGGGMNETVVVDFKDDGSGVFKPRTGEEYLRTSIEVGTYYKRERAAYLASQFLGLKMVPPTVVRRVDDKIGSVQQFIPNARLLLEMDISESYEIEERLEDQFKAMWMFDLLIMNADRHANNFLISGEKGEEELIAIDNGLAFAKNQKRLFRAFQDKSMPQEVVDKVVKLYLDEEKQELLADLLLELLPEDRVVDFLARLQVAGKCLKKKGKISKRAYKHILNI